jgi:hypothetical protein
VENKFGFPELVPLGQATHAPVENKFGFPELVPAAEQATAVGADEDPEWADYGRMVMAGGAQIGAGVGWLFDSADWGQALKETSQDASEYWMKDLSPQARNALQVEFTSRDNGELWTQKKWNKAKLTAAQSLLGTAAGMGVGSVLTKGLAAAGMRTAATTAGGATAQVPSKVAGALGYGLGEAAVAAPSVGAGIESEIMGMDHEVLYDQAADYRSIYDGLENVDPAVRADRAKRLLAKAAAGDGAALALVSTFILSAPAGAFMSKITAGMPLTQGGGRLAGGARGAGTEAVQEFAQSGAEKIAENTAMQQADPSRGYTEGALEEAVGGALAGGLIGAGPGLAANPNDAVVPSPAGPALEDSESPLAALAGTEEAAPVSYELPENEPTEPVSTRFEFPKVEEPQDDLDSTLATAQKEWARKSRAGIEAVYRGDELDAALGDAYAELGILTQAQQDAKQAQETDEADLQAAVMQLEQDVQESAARRAQILPVEEVARDEQIRKMRNTAFAQAEEQQRQQALLDQDKTDRQKERGFEEIEKQNREEAYGQHRATADAAGGGINVFEGQPLGEAIQDAIQNAPPEDPDAAPPAPGEDPDAAPPAPEEDPDDGPPTPPRIVQSAAPNTAVHSLLEMMARTSENRLSGAAFESEGVDPADMRDETYKYKNRTPFMLRGKEGMEPDALAEWMSEQGFINSETGTTEWDANSALEAVRSELSGDRVYHPAATETVQIQKDYEQQVQDYEIAQSRKTEPTVQRDGQVDIFGKNETAQGLADLSRARDRARNQGQDSTETGDPSDIFSQARQQVDLEDAPGESEAEREAREEDEATRAMRGEGFENEEDDLGDIPGWDNLDAEAATSPANDIPEPTEAQKKAGNYKKAKITVKGLPITIENPKGSIRNGKEQTEHYGYIRLTEGNDGDQLDVFVNPNIQTDYKNQVYVIDQINQETGEFDEHKVMLGYQNQLAAVRAYKTSYPKNWKMGSVTATTMTEFKMWSGEPTNLSQPASGNKVLGKQSRTNRKTSKGKTSKQALVAKAQGEADLESVESDYSVRFSNKRVLAADGQETANAPNLKWVNAVLGVHAGQQKNPASTKSQNELVDELIRIDEQRQAEPTYGKAQIEQDTATLRKTMPGAPITVLESHKDAPTEIIEEIERLNMTEANGVSDPNTGAIYLFADKIPDTETAVKTVLHETTHKGLRVAFGKELDPLLDDLFKNTPKKYVKKLQKIVDSYNLDVGNQEDRREASEELLAIIAESDPKNSMLKKVIAKVRQVLRNLGIVNEYSDGDITAIIAEAKGAIGRRTDRITGVTLEEDVLMEETGEVFTIEENAAEIIMQHDKRIKNCERLKACL